MEQVRDDRGTARSQVLEDLDCQARGQDRHEVGDDAVIEAMHRRPGRGEVGGVPLQGGEVDVREVDQPGPACRVPSPPPARQDAGPRAARTDLEAGHSHPAVRRPFQPHLSDPDQPFVLDVVPGSVQHVPAQQQLTRGKHGLGFVHRHRAHDLDRGPAKVHDQVHDAATTIHEATRQQRSHDRGRPQQRAQPDRAVTAAGLTGGGPHPGSRRRPVIDRGTMRR
jgi:hypothetical protein